VVLLAGAGLLTKSLYRLLHTDIGLQPDHLAVLQVGTSDFTNVNNERNLALEKQVLGRIANLPGVTSVGIASCAPAGDGDGTREIRVLGRPFHGEHNDVLHRVVSPAYFATLKARLMRGRFFTEADDTSKPRVAIINQALARQYFSDEDPIGRRITHTDDLPRFQQPPMEIVGLVSDIQEGPLDMVVRPAMYVPFDQNPRSWFAVVVRTTQAEEFLLPSLTAAIHEIDPGIETYGGATMSEKILDSPSAYLRRSAAWLAGSFAVLALLLSVVGLYGVIAYSVGKRTREIGIRMALGAQRRSVCQLILIEAAWLTGAGIAGGLVCAVAAAALMRRLLFGVQSWDAPTLVSVSVLLAMLALLASYLPARRAANVEPMEALRCE
jgi:predicted permease